jgi:gamma-glutamyl-gamma-aminobutyrate hydrolase PuuD
MAKKKIFISPILKKNKYKEIEFSVGKNWYNFLKKLNYNYYSFYSSSINDIEENLSFSSGVIIQGTGDISKVKKNSENFLRDQFEKKVIDICLKKKIPILGVCRGFQLMNYLFKGKIKKVGDHIKINHYIYFANKKNFLKTSKIKVNSFHNYSISNLGRVLRPVAKCKEGFIEMAENKEYMILCMMFHPERKNFSQSAINLIIKNFFK